MKFCQILFIVIFLISKSHQIDKFSSKYVEALEYIINHFNFKDISVFCNVQSKNSKTLDLIIKIINLKGKIIQSDLNLHQEFSSELIFLISGKNGTYNLKNLKRKILNYKLLIIISSSKDSILSMIEKQKLFHKTLLFFDGRYFKLEQFSNKSFRELKVDEIYFEMSKYMKGYKLGNSFFKSTEVYRTFP